MMTCLVRSLRSTPLLLLAIVALLQAPVLRAEVKPPNTVLESACGNSDTVTTICLAQNITSGQRFILLSTPDTPREFLPILNFRHEPGPAGAGVLQVYSATRVRTSDGGDDGRYPVEEALELQTWEDRAADGSISAVLKRVGASSSSQFRLEPVFHTMGNPRGPAGRR